MKDQFQGTIFQEYETIGKMVYAGYHKPSEFQELKRLRLQLNIMWMKSNLVF